jgi:monoamine oxidase
LPLTRRAFIAVAASAAACRPKPQRARDPIVIVGAGLAGLRAADLLIRAGQPVIVLEARDAPGGRVRTIRSGLRDGLYGEAGAVRIASRHHRVISLARDLALPLMPFTSSVGSSSIVLGGVRLRIPDDLGSVAKRMHLKTDEAGLAPAELLRRYVGVLPEGMRDANAPIDLFADWRRDDAVSWPDWLRGRGASAGAITLMTLGGDSRDLSALYVLRQIALLGASDEFYKIDGGMDQLTQALAVAAGDRIRYGAAVVRIDRAPDVMRVEYVQRDRASVIRASRVILAIPFSTLQRVSINPDLPAPKARVIAELPYFPATRFILQSSTRPWEANNSDGSVRTDDPAEIWDAAYEQPGPEGVIGVTVGGAIGDRLAAVSETEASSFGVDLATRAMPELRGAIQQRRIVRWAAEPWARGAFAVFRPGQMTTSLPHLAPAEGRIHFAGEHTSPWMGWMEGALESAERVVREVQS